MHFKCLTNSPQPSIFHGVLFINKRDNQYKFLRPLKKKKLTKNSKISDFFFFCEQAITKFGTPNL